VFKQLNSGSAVTLIVIIFIDERKIRVLCLKCKSLNMNFLFIKLLYKILNET